MAKFFPQLDTALRDFIAEQKIFFTATAPADGRINLSPKGMDTLRCVDDATVAYLDLTGSGNETAAHLAENGRITIMVCAFSGPPRIVRLYGRGTVAPADTPPWNELIGRFAVRPGARQVIVAEISRVQTSCGFGVPVMEFVEQRQTLPRWAEAKGEDLPRYRRQKNATSIDGLPAPLGP
jgi:hypothetical protein